MTSEERREARFRRRKAKRDAKKKAMLAKHDYYSVFSHNALAKAAKEATKNVTYKASVKRYMQRRLVNIAILNDNLIHKRDIRKGFICFSLFERGKLRNIMSVHFAERVPQKSLNQNALAPVLMNSIIYDNGASQRGKGTSFALRRMVTHLQRHYRKFGTEGYILLIDFSDYFNNIDHDVAKSIIDNAFEDEGIKWLSFLFIDAHYEHNKKHGRDERKGLGLGSEINQTMAIMLPNAIDHYVKEVLKIKGYGRYMDDSYLIHESKEYLRYCLREICKKCKELKIEINMKKTRIVKLSRGFQFLKTHFWLTETGKVIKKPCHDAIVRQRRKMKRQKRLLDRGELSFEDIKCSYSSWRGSLQNKNARMAIRSMDKLFDSLFIDSWKGGMEDGE